MKADINTDPKPRNRTFFNYAFKSPIIFTMLISLLVISWKWPRRWLSSGAPALQFALLVGESQGHCFMSNRNLWPLLIILHLAYAICSTSWLLYWGFSVLCYISIFFVCLFQFPVVGNTARRALRVELKQFHFVDDKIAFFQIPAIEIDLKVDGLIVVRGFTFLLSNMSLLIHSIEIGIRLSEDMEIAFQAETLCFNLFRSIEISDCFVNIKAGKFEMTFGHLEVESKGVDNDAVLKEDTPLLLAASKDSDQRSFDLGIESKLIASSKIQINQSTLLDDVEARDHYNNILDFFKHTDAVSDARQHIKQTKVNAGNTEQSFDVSDTNAIRAAICSELHSHPSISHPPPRSIKMSVIKNFIPTRIQTLIHRVPLLLRLILGHFSYFHPIKLSSITATTSGRFLDSVLVSEVFQSYEDTDTEIKLLKNRISAWLSEANFAVELSSITGNIQVPFLSQHDMSFSLNFEDVMAYRSLPGPVHLTQVARLGGADARFRIPIFLLPHHEHLFPPLPTAMDEEKLSRDIEQADGRPKEVQAINKLTEVLKDEANVKVSVHARLPAVFHQDLLNFIVALLKASKIVEMEREGEANAIYDEAHGLKELSQNWKGVKRSFKRTLVDGVVNEKWIAKLVGKVTTRLELAQGEAGYSGNLPIKLEKFRTGLFESEGEKLLP